MQRSSVRPAARLALLAWAPRPANAISLGTLITLGGSIQAGDLLFSHFDATVSCSRAGVCGSTDLGSIWVGAIGDIASGIAFGHRAGSFAVQEGSRLKLSIAYQVAVSDPSALVINGGMTFFGATLVGGPDASGFAQLTETLSAPGGALVGQVTVGGTFEGPLISTFQGFDLSQPVPVAVIHKTITLEAFATPLGDPVVTLAGGSQQFTQVSAPEPSSLLVLAVGVAGAAGAERRRRRPTEPGHSLGRRNPRVRGGAHGAGPR